MRRTKVKLALGLIGSAFIFLFVSSALPVSATVYGAGDYGECPYSAASTNCDIAISNNGFTLFLNVTPSLSGSCTRQSDQVTVNTYDPNGFALSLANDGTNINLNDIEGSANNIPATSGNLASPLALSDTWGYRVDGAGGFGSGPTTAVTNAAPDSSIKFAKTQPSSGTADTILNTSTLNSSVSSTIWYGVCLDNSLTIPPGTYASTIRYTATAN